MAKEDLQIITLRPSIKQYVIDQLPLFVLLALLLIIGGLPGFPFEGVALALSLFLSLCLLYRFAYIRRIRYIIGSEEIICEHGVFRRSTHYMEMYRIVDFAERQSFMQQLFGLKTVTLLSMDRSTPKLELIGMKQKSDVVPMIRKRVERNKERRGVYEITNR